MSSWLRRGLWVPPLLLVLVAVLGLLIRLGDLANQEILLSIWLTGNQTQPWSWLFGVIAVALSPVGAPILTLLAALVVWWRRTAALALGLLALTFAGWGFAAVIKPLVGRPRPDASVLLDPISPQVGFLSFPSGHTAFAAAFASALVLVLVPRARRRLGFVVGAVAVSLVALSRIYVGAHFLTDVTAGAILGVSGVWFALSWWVWWRTRPTSSSHILKQN
ncbi:MAG: phosphatase PAP2 family protein [Actinomycetaceae bacterium]|nr:phosphatase PAP2 family protein [Actinomycetaceae bacterium]